MSGVEPLGLEVPFMAGRPRRRSRFGAQRILTVWRC